MPLYSFGSNSSSQLALGHTEDVSAPTICHFSPSYAAPTCPPQAIICGGNHTLLLYSCGDVYAAGKNSSGQCGLSPTVTGATIGAFTRIPNPAPPYPEEGQVNKVEVSDAIQWGFCTAGWEFSVLATRDGRRLFVCGAGSKGELGLGPGTTCTILGADIPNSTLYRIPNFPPEGASITSLSSSITHIVAVLNTGVVYGWGQSRKGQIHLQPDTIPLPKITYTPTRTMHVPFPVAYAACTQETTFLISATGDQCTLLGPVFPKWALREKMPKCSELTNFVGLQAAWDGYYILLSDGRVVAWGKGHKGQLPPENLAGVKMMAVGSEHVLVVTERYGEDRLLAWGWGEHGNCGELEGGGDVVPVREVSIAEGGKKARVKCIGAGCATSWVWVD